MKNIRNKIIIEMYKQMWRIRKFEEKVYYFFSKGEILGTCHLSIGEEACAVGTVFPMKKENDYLHGNHRGHGLAISYGSNINEIMSEIFGKVTGVCKGKGGSMHIADVSSGYLGANGILGASMPISVGAALALRMQKKEDSIVICVFGDGSSNQGAFHESMNLAALWKLPIIFVCVNNLYGMSMHIERSMSNPDLKKRGVPYNIKAVSINGNDFIEVYNTILKARKYVLKKGPMLVIENTYRHMGHAKMDANKYRTKEEIEKWKKSCPIKYAGEYLIKNNLATKEQLKKYEESAQKEIEDAVKFARESSSLAVEDIFEDVFAE
jgi:TPP-dependent pyruvate/acetoin dehydrogenase alpha subunit